MEDYKKKLDLICEAVDDYRKGELSPAAAFMAITTITSPREIDPEAKKWATEQLGKWEDR